MRLECLDEPSSNPARCQQRLEVIRGFMPIGSVGAEVGVFKGAFIDYLLSTNPAKLYAVDPWYRLFPEWSWARGDKSTVRALQAILAEFEPEITAKKLEPRVEFSQDFLKSIPDNHLDWIYIDSSHAYQQTLLELNLSLSKVSKSGFIIGDDYYPNPKSVHHGVYKAVHELEVAGKLKLVSKVSTGSLLPKGFESLP